MSSSSHRLFIKLAKNFSSFLRQSKSSAKSPTFKPINETANQKTSDYFTTTGTKVTVLLTVWFSHARTDEDDLLCKHNFIDCEHHPHDWRASQIGRDVRRFKPIYYNTPPDPIMDWWEREVWC